MKDLERKIFENYKDTAAGREAVNVCLRLKV